MGQKKEIFINIMTDYGFKRLFGSLKFKSVLIRFLNIMFESEGVKVDDVTYHDKEVLPKDEDGKRIIYDVYCTSKGEKEHFILEMQQVYHINFENRVMFYLCKGLTEQGKVGEEYILSPVYGIFFVDFYFEHLTKKLVHDFRMMETERQQVFSNLLRLLIVCLKEAKPTWEDCNTQLEKLIYIIKNMHNMDKESNAYKSGEFDEMFEAAEIDNLAAEDVVAYSESKQKLKDIQLAYQYSYSAGEAAGRAAGEAAGRASGRAEERVSMIHAMRNNGLSAELISMYLGLSLSDVEKIIG